VAVHLYLAELLDQSAQTSEALVHYRRYLDLVVRQPRETRPEARQVALVVMKFADALARTGERRLAASQYDLAARIAHQTGLAEIEAQARQRASDMDR
jgi:hypothetical protein